MSVTHVVADDTEALAVAVDAGLAQIPRSHFVYLNVLCGQGTDEQRKFLFGEVLAGTHVIGAETKAGKADIANSPSQGVNQPERSSIPSFPIEMLGKC